MQGDPTPGDGTLDTNSTSVALALGRQRLLDAHFRFLLELIQRTNGHVPAPRALAIYARMHRLTELDIQALRNRVLVHLGEASAVKVTELPHTFVAVDGGVEWDVTASLAQRIRKRLNGRRQHELRAWVDLHAGYVETELVKLHIENLVALAEAAGDDVPHGDVVRTYVREVRAAQRIADTLFCALQARMYERTVGEAPAGVAGEAPARRPKAARVTKGKTAEGRKAPMFPDPAYRNA